MSKKPKPAAPTPTPTPEDALDAEFASLVTAESNPAPEAPALAPVAEPEVSVKRAPVVLMADDPNKVAAAVQEAMPKAKSYETEAKVESMSKANAEVDLTPAPRKLSPQTLAEMQRGRETISRYK